MRCLATRIVTIFTVILGVCQFLEMPRLNYHIMQCLDLTTLLLVFDSPWTIDSTFKSTNACVNVLETVALSYELEKLKVYSIGTAEYNLHEGLEFHF
jgi:hypothetical protein